MDYLSISYFATVFTVAALAGVFRTVRNGDYRSVSHCIGVAGVSGFLGFGVVALVAGDHSRTDFNPVWYLGVSAIIGLAGKEQNEMISILWQNVMKSRVIDDKTTNT